MTKADLIAFEREVADHFEAGRIRAPCHLAGGNENELIAIFKEIPREAWVFSTWRSHYHALLHGIPRERVMAEILAGRSINLHFPDYRFFTSAIVGGILPIACGVAAAGGNVWAFIGDMTASIGAFRDAWVYAFGHNLPITFVVEDNGLSTNTPTDETWGMSWEQRAAVIKNPSATRMIRYHYQRTYPHVGSGVYVAF